MATAPFVQFPIPTRLRSGSTGGSFRALVKNSRNLTNADNGATLVMTGPWTLNITSGLNLSLGVDVVPTAEGASVTSDGPLLNGLAPTIQVRNEDFSIVPDFGDFDGDPLAVTLSENYFVSGAAAVVVAPSGLPVWVTAAAQSTPENAGFSLNLVCDLNCTFSVVGGADAARFSISQAAVCDFGPQDYDTPNDANADRIYDVTIRATNALDPSKYTDRTFHITVTDVDDPTDWDLSVYRSNMLFSFDASNNASLGLTDALLVTNHLDSSPKANHASQSADINKVLYVPASSVNSLPAIRNTNTADAARYLSITNIGRDISSFLIWTDGGVVKAAAGLYYVMNGAIVNQGPIPLNTPILLTYIMTGGGGWKLRLNGTLLAAGDAGATFWENVQPLPGIYFLVCYFRTAPVSSPARIFVYGTLFNADPLSASANIDADISQQFFIANAVEA